MKTYLKFLIITILISGQFCSCSKNEETKPSPKERPDIYVRDLNNGEITSGQPTGIAKPIYFNLGSQQTVAAGSDWDIAFGGIANTVISSNSKSGTWMKVLNVDYASIHSKPSISYDESESGNIASYENGWYIYNVRTHVVEPIRGKTFFIQTAKGKHYKLKMISIYKDAPEYPTSMDKATFLTFQYCALD